MSALTRLLTLRPGYKTYAAGGGLLLLGGAQLLLGIANPDHPAATDLDTAVQTALAGLAVLGLGHKIERKLK